MKIYSIALQSIKRKKSKNILLIAGLLLSVASVITIMTVSKNINENVAAALDEYGANILVTPKSDNLSLNYAGISISSTSYESHELNNEDIIKIRNIKNKKNISIVAPKLFVLTEISGKNVIVAGIKTNEEFRLKKWWKLRGKKPDASDEIFIGANLAGLLSLRVKDTLTISGEKFIITGVLEKTGAQDDGMLFMSVDKAQSLFSKGNKISLIEIAALCYDCPIDEIVSQISAKLPGASVTPIKQAIESKMTAIHRFEHFSLGVSAIILIISMLIVFTNINASVNERTREIGIFQAVGFRRIHIMQIILLEVIMISLTAGALGYITGILAAKFIVPILSMNSNVSVGYDINILFLSLIFSVLLGMLGGFYPAYRATRLDPTAAFRAL
ncbi:ABC transporter membrane protein [Melioribacter roseus P3M-2]|uniref:ABC transporter membrane protein n=1 Tax=Melioribacter roseus (strain DSM 23840 / JCM 17771 / VKM B-2668 / P3M-2) TaxID=1191523 RepID=I6Z4F6_MELRP|nr:ABC transporter permease [Melioribacter roseus]AFN74020.1 ABC transporter membrane protein [Melioribacter roseus P3M-2]